MGYRVGEVVAKRMGRTLLELGGNNAVIVMDDANQELALRGILFGAVGTAGQRCTTIRRLFVQRGIAAGFEEKLVAAYRQIPIGDPMDNATLIGPLIDAAAIEAMDDALQAAVEQGGTVVCGGGRIEDRRGFYVQSCHRQGKARYANRASKKPLRRFSTSSNLRLSMR